MQSFFQMEHLASWGGLGADFASSSCPYAQIIVPIIAVVV